jgi:hypothetical protein
MDTRLKWAVAIATILVATTVGFIAYNLGVSHGMAINLPADTAVAMPHFVGFRPFGFFFPFFFVFLFFFAMRLIFWGAFHRRGWYYSRAWEGAPNLDEWHRRAHEKMSSQPPA